MALQLPYTSPAGTDYPTAYGRVSVVQIIRVPRSGMSVRYWIDLYADQAKSQAERASIGTVMGQWEQAGIQVTTAEVYAHAKTLPEFAGAADV